MYTVSKLMIEINCKKHFNIITAHLIVCAVRDYLSKNNRTVLTFEKILYVYSQDSVLKHKINLLTYFIELSVVDTLIVDSANEKQSFIGLYDVNKKRD